MFAPTGSSSNILFDMFDDFKTRVEKTVKSEFDKLLDEINVGFDALEKSSNSISKNLGRGMEFGFGIRQAFADALPSVVALGGKIEDINKIQQGVIASTGRGVILAAEEYEKLFASVEVMGTTADELFSTFKTIGVSVHDVSKEAEKIMKTAANLGTNVQQVYQAVSRNMEKINTYNFQNGVEGLARMAAKATALKIDMGQTFQFAEKVMNPEGAIEMANAFQRLGAGTSALLDPLKLMDLSMNDPEELQNQLVKMTQQYTKFNSETGRFEITNKRMFRELAKELGLSYDELTKMALGGAELNKKLSEIQFPKDAVSKEDREMIANMAEMKDGQYVVKVQEDGKLKEKSIAELSLQDIEYLKQQPKTIEEVQKQSLTTQESMAADIAAIRARIVGGIARSNTVEQINRMGKNFTQSLNKLMDKFGITPKSIGGAADEITKKLTEIKSGGDITKVLGDIVKMINKNTGFNSADFAKGFKDLYLGSDLFKGGIGSDPAMQKMVVDLLKNAIKVEDALITSDGDIVKFKEGDLIVAAREEQISPTLKGEANPTPQPMEDRINTAVNLPKFVVELPKTPETPKMIADTTMNTLISQLLDKGKNMVNTESNKQEMSGSIDINFNISVTPGTDPKVIHQISDAIKYNQEGISERILYAVQNAGTNRGITGNQKLKGVPKNV